MQLIPSPGSSSGNWLWKSTDGQDARFKYDELDILGSIDMTRLTNPTTLGWTKASPFHTHAKMEGWYWISWCGELEVPTLVLTACIYCNPPGSKCGGLNQSGIKIGYHSRNSGSNSLLGVSGQSGSSRLNSLGSLTEGPQASPLLSHLGPYTIYSVNARFLATNQEDFSNLSPRVVYSTFKSRITKSLNKDGRYGDLINIIGDPSVLILAYLSIKGNPGNMTPGFVTAGHKPETLNGIDHDFFLHLSRDIRSGRFNFGPARRVLIPKPGKSEKRPLGVGNPRDKIVQKAISMVLNVIYEPVFLSCSHGFRPGRGCHSALQELQTKHGNSFVWAVEGDISKCFDSITHDIILKLLRKRIDCPATLNLIQKSLKAGFVDPITNKLVVPPAFATTSQNPRFHRGGLAPPVLQSKTGLFNYVE